MGNCLICQGKLYGPGICDQCKPVVDKVLELRSKNKTWFRELFNRNVDIETVEGYDYMDEQPIITYSLSKEKFVNLIMDLLK